MRADFIKFELSPRGNSNSLKFAHEHLLNQFFIDQGVTGLIATSYFCQPVYGTIASDYNLPSSAITNLNSRENTTQTCCTLWRARTALEPPAI